jgi:hypothetical protein
MSRQCRWAMARWFVCALDAVPWEIPPSSPSSSRLCPAVDIALSVRWMASILLACRRSRSPLSVDPLVSKFKVAWSRSCLFFPGSTKLGISVTYSEWKETAATRAKGSQLLINGPSPEN